MASFPPQRKTVVGNLGRTPIKTTLTGAARTAQPPIKTVVGGVSRPPVKTVVGNLAAPRPKTLVGNMQRPPLKTTPGNLGTGGTQPLGMEVADRGPINTPNPISGSRSIGDSDGNLGRSVNNMPPPTPGPPNASLDWAKQEGYQSIQDGGMGPTAKRMGVSPRRRSAPRNPSQFFGE